MSAVASADPPRTPRAPGALAGLLLTDKPTGVTSHDLVARARRALGVRAIGHLGTLDPDASGLLVLVIGPATRCAPVWQGGTKTYEASARLGITTTTQDLSGETLATRDVRVGEDDVRRAALALTGEIEQVPPMVSALKHRGERLHAIARRGETVERAPRRVRVESWEWLGFALPEVRFRVRVSGGTYVRTLAHDLGESLGCGAALSALRRTRSEPLGLDRAVSWTDLATLDAGALWAKGGIGLDRALDVLPAATLDDAEALAIGAGGRPRRPAAACAGLPLAAGPRSLVMRDLAGAALALGELVPVPEDGGTLALAPHVVFPWAVREGRP